MPPSLFPPEQGTDGRRLTVLVAEDDPEVRALVVTALLLDGWDVIAAPDGRRALDAIADTMVLDSTPGKRPPDAIVTDLRMPGVSGLSLLAGIRARGFSTPVVVMTAHDIASTRPVAEELGASAVFGKPFDVDDLRTAVLNLVRAHRMAKARA
jgi:DNA-binding response OmpR family regulator